MQRRNVAIGTFKIGGKRCSEKKTQTLIFGLNYVVTNVGAFLAAIIIAFISSKIDKRLGMKIGAIVASLML